MIGGESRVVTLPLQPGLLDLKGTWRRREESVEPPSPLLPPMTWLPVVSTWGEMRRKTGRAYGGSARWIFCKKPTRSKLPVASATAAIPALPSTPGSTENRDGVTSTSPIKPVTTSRTHVTPAPVAGTKSLYICNFLPFISMKEFYCSAFKNSVIGPEKCVWRK